MRNLFRRIVTNNWLFYNNGYIDAKAFYLHSFGEMPSISYITKVDVTKSYRYIHQNLKPEILRIHQHSEFNHDEKKLLFNMTLMVLRNRRFIELSGEHVALLHGSDDYAWANALLGELASFRTVEETKQNIGFTRSMPVNDNMPV